MNDKYLYIIRGVPGSGKTSFAKSLGFRYFEADSYFYKDGIYKFDPLKLRAAHESCINRLEEAMQISYNSTCDRLIVSNTNTREKELKPYLELAAKYDYQVFIMVLEKRHNNKNEHGVPDEKIVEMAERLKLNIKLS